MVRLQGAICTCTIVIFTWKRNFDTSLVSTTRKVLLLCLHNELNAEKSPFWQNNALFASKAKINVFKNLFRTEWPPKDPLE